MLKLLLGLVAAVGATVLAGVTLQSGCRDVNSSLTRLEYYEIRDMRRSVAISPQKKSLRAPDSLSVPVTGRERAPTPRELETDREKASARFRSPGAPDDSTIARGARSYGRFCAACHGKTMAGDGPVAAKFMPPPDLLSATPRGRSDGYIYSYIRYGGPIMPSYGYALSPEETWDLIHYVRREQKANPR